MTSHSPAPVECDLFQFNTYLVTVFLLKLHTPSASNDTGNMESGEGSSTQMNRTQDDTIQAGNTLLLRLPSGDIKTWKLEKDSCALHFLAEKTGVEPCFSTANLGKFGSFYANELIGQPFGRTYEIVEKRLKAVPPRTLQEVGTNATTRCV